MTESQDKETTRAKMTSATAAAEAASSNSEAKIAVSSSSTSSPFLQFSSFTAEEKDQMNKLQHVGCEVRDLKLHIQSKQENENTNKQENDEDEDTKTLNQLLFQMNDIRSQLGRSILREVKTIIRILEGKSPSTDNNNNISNEDGLESEAIQLTNMLPSGKPRKDMEKRLRAIRKQKKAAQKSLFDKSLHTKSLRIQRKIHHLLSSTGLGDTFQYYPNSLNTEINKLVPNQLIVLTEKWDGTTVQATNKGIFKRSDKFTKGDARKFQTMKEEERYDIERLDVGFDEFLATKNGGSTSCRGGGDKSCKYIREAIEPYYPIFASMDDDICVYFEAVGTKIQARFKTCNIAPYSNPEPSSSSVDSDYWHDIRVFDFTRNGQFLSWNETKSLALKLKLPLVGFTDPPMPLNINQIVGMLRSGLTYDVKSDVNHPANCALLEGYVVRGLIHEHEGKGGIDEQPQRTTERDEEPIAKIRVEDLEQFAPIEKELTK
uniref:RNA ligase domain-containing protein n=1 Tax=Ditylum brightwellii TaxID=49249 RepID=A0A7S2ESW6_9STRA|mmetsp:Transcript_4454/g.6730  ORF Transcript_4454/g.6730 Transcript_4454/m.6730 type:complete len:489 (+) Transcript_4454:238-1704(+)